MMWWWICGVVYLFGAIGTLAYNLHDMVFITNPFVIARNALLWPVFLPILIVLKDLER